jgi:hypothetical protein
MKNLILATALFALTATAFAQDLTINGAEFGIGKFHRRDNKEHTYEANNAWKPFILPEDVSTKEAYIQKNSETNYTIFFTSLDEFLAKIVELTKKTGKKVAILNLNAHGLPGGMWFPKDAKTRDSFECMSWRQAANNSDDDNYNQYYSEVSKSEILQFNQLANAPKIPSYSCLTGLPEWTAIVNARPEIKTVFAANAQIHMLSCIVGMGTLGDTYTKGLANLLLSSGKVMTSFKFGLGDWSMPQGMGFWGYESDEQLDRDNARYPHDRNDSEQAQKGDIRVAVKDATGAKSGVIQSVDYMLLVKDNRAVKAAKSAPVLKMNLPLPKSVRIPGTNAFVQLK